MKPWMMVLMGTGPVNSPPGESANDGGVLVREFIEHAQACGHEITGAHFKVVAADGSADAGTFDPLADGVGQGEAADAASAPAVDSVAATLDARSTEDQPGDAEAELAPQGGGDATG